jgi:integrase
VSTFREQAEHWLAEQEGRIRPSSVATFRSILRTHLLPRFSDRSLDELALQNNRALRDLVNDLRDKLAPASIQLVITVAKQVLESEIDDNGLPIRALRWSTNFINAPTIANQRQPTVTAEQVEAACADSKHGRLYLLLATSGLRISEALNLVKDDVEPDGSAVAVRQSKTPNGVRTVDLHPTVAVVMAELAEKTTAGKPIFPFSESTLRLHQRVPGFHSLRRFRESVLQRSECRSILINAWLGHADNHMSTRYGRQLLDDRAYRQEWTARAGLGFTFAEHLYHDAALQPVMHDSLTTEEH